MLREHERETLSHHGFKARELQGQLLCKVGLPVDLKLITDIFFPVI